MAECKRSEVIAVLIHLNVGWFILARLEGINSGATVGGWRVHEAFSLSHPRRLKNSPSLILSFSKTRYHNFEKASPSQSFGINWIWDSYSCQDAEGLFKGKSCSTRLDCSSGAFFDSRPKNVGSSWQGNPLDAHFYALMSLLMLNLQHCIYSSADSDNFPKQIECICARQKR